MVKNEDDIVNPIKFIGCCDAYDKIYLSFNEGYYKSYKLGYDAD